MSTGKIEHTPEGWVFWKSNVTKSEPYSTKQAAEDAYNEWRIGPDGPDGPDKGKDPDDDDTPGGNGGAGGAGIDPAVAEAFRNRGGFGR